MKIGFDAKRAFNNFTGLGNYSRFVLDALNKHYPQHSYNLFTPSIRENPESKALTDEFLVHKAPHSNPILKTLWRYFQLHTTIKEESIEIFHGLSNELPLLKPSGVKEVVTIHDLIFLRHPEWYPLVDRKIYTYKVKMACKRADKIVAISDQTKQDIIKYFNVPESKITVIYQGVHPNFNRRFTAPELTEIKGKYNLPDEFILNVGTIEKRKNVLLILKALKAGKITIPLVIVGKPTSYKKEVEAYILKNNLGSQVIFLHNVDFNDLPGIYDLSSLLIYPSVFEGFGIPVIEALHRRIPVITSRGSCFSEAGGNLARYIDPFSVEDLAEAIKECIGAKMNPALLDQHLANFAPQKIAADYMELYKKLF